MLWNLLALCNCRDNTNARRCLFFCFWCCLSNMTINSNGSTKSSSNGNWSSSAGMLWASTWSFLYIGRLDESKLPLQLAILQLQLDPGPGPTATTGCYLIWVLRLGRSTKTCHKNFFCQNWLKNTLTRKLVP